MKIDELKKRLEELINQKAQAHNTLIALDGAMQECRAWIAKLEKEEDKKDEEA